MQIKFIICCNSFLIASNLLLLQLPEDDSTREEKNYNNEGEDNNDNDHDKSERAHEDSDFGNDEAKYLLGDEGPTGKEVYNYISISELNLFLLFFFFSYIFLNPNISILINISLYSVYLEFTFILCIIFLSCPSICLYGHE